MDINEKPGINGVISILVHDAATGKLIEEESSINNNLMCTLGFAQFAQILANISPSSGVGFQIGVGTSSVAPGAGDPDLGARVYRANLTTLSASGAVVTMKLFLDTGQANGSTLTEAGLFWNNVLIDHALFSSSVNKDVTKTLTVQIAFTLS